MENTIKKRSLGFDALKGISCMLVVISHCQFPTKAWIIIQCMIRWLVPLFFAVSGYYFRKADMEYTQKKIKHVLGIALWSSVFYIIFEILFHFANGDFYEYAATELTITNFLAFVVFNSPIFVNGHLWFIYSLLYVYIAQAVIIRFNLVRWEMPSILILLGCHFLLSYGTHFMGYDIPGGFYRNFLFEGLPLFFLGKYMYRTLRPKIENSDRNTVRIWTLLIMVLFLGTSVLERLLLGREFALHISNIFVLMCLFTFVINGDLEKLPKWLVNVGVEDSLMVYILHPAVYFTMDLVFFGILDEGTGLYNLYQWVRPVATVVVSLLFSKAFNCVKRICAKSGDKYNGKV